MNRLRRNGSGKGWVGGALFLAAASLWIGFAPRPVFAGGEGAELALLPKAVYVNVTGENAPADVFVPLVVSEILQHMKLSDGAAYAVETSRILAPPFVGRGASAEVLVPLHFWKNGAPVERRVVRATVRNLALSRPAEPGNVIYVSNSPERLDRPGRLLSGTIGGNESARFLMHHANGTAGPLYFAVSFRNAASTPAVLQVIEGSAEADRDEVAAGHVSARRFLANYGADTGGLISIRPNGSILFQKTLVPKEGIFSALLEARNLSSSPLETEVRVMNGSEGARAELEDIAVRSAARSHGIFQGPNIRKQTSYTVGEAWRFIGIGDDSLTGRFGDEPMALRGNYGVLYDVLIEMKNPRLKPEKVQILFSPTGGAAKGSFLVDGEMREVKLVKPPDVSELASYEIPAGGSRIVRLRTTPQSGSNYPVRLVVKESRVSYR